MIVEIDDTFDKVDITLNAKEAEAILNMLFHQPNTDEQFNAAREFRMALDGFLAEMRLREKGDCLPVVIPCNECGQTFEYMRPRFRFDTDLDGEDCPSVCPSCEEKAEPRKTAPVPRHQSTCRHVSGSKSAGVCCQNDGISGIRLKDEEWAK